VAVLVGAWALVLVPWAHRNYQAYGRLLPNTVGLSGVPVIGAEIGRSCLATRPRAVVRAWLCDLLREAALSNPDPADRAGIRRAGGGEPRRPGQSIPVMVSAVAGPSRRRGAPKPLSDGRTIWPGTRVGGLYWTVWPG